MHLQLTKLSQLNALRDQPFLWQEVKEICADVADAAFPQPGTSKHTLHHCHTLVVLIFTNTITCKIAEPEEEWADGSCLQVSRSWPSMSNINMGPRDQLVFVLSYLGGNHSNQPSVVPEMHHTCQTVFAPNICKRFAYSGVCFPTA